MSEPAVQTVVEHGEASSLPDTSWAWRRLLIFLVCISSIGLDYWIVHRIDDIPTLRMVATYAMGLQALCLFLYVAGASATDVVRLVSAVRTTRRETITTAPPPAVIAPSGAVATGSAAAAATTPAATGAVSIPRTIP